MMFELKLFAASVFENKLCFKFKNKLRAISCSMQQNFGEIFYLFCCFCQKLCINANFHVYCLKSGKLGIYLTTYGRVKACLFTVRMRKAQQTTQKAVQFVVSIENGFLRKNFCTGSKN